MEMIKADSLSFSYGREAILNDVSFSVKKGEAVGILGDNGTGKSTLLSILATTLYPDSGQVVYGEEVQNPKSFTVLREKIGYVPQKIALYENRSLVDNLKLFGAMYGMTKAERKASAQRWIDLLEMEEESGKIIKKLSGGMQRRANLAVALIHEPEILILDEPLVGIDFESRKKILAILMDLKTKGITMIYTTHSMEEVQSLADRVLLLEKGEIKVDEQLIYNDEPWFEKFDCMEDVVKSWMIKGGEGK